MWWYYYLIVFRSSQAKYVCNIDILNYVSLIVQSNVIMLVTVLLETFTTIKLLTIITQQYTTL